MTKNEALVFADRLKEAEFQVWEIHRREERKGYNCKLRDAKQRYGAWLTVHTSSPLDWDITYTWENLLSFPLWYNGDRVPTDRIENVKVVKRGKRGLVLTE